jgi:hypothetical protein
MAPAAIAFFFSLAWASLAARIKLHDASSKERITSASARRASAWTA